MLFRKAEAKDIDKINEIYKSGSEFLAEKGVDQWQGNLRPRINNEKQLENIYILIDDNKIVSTALVLDFDKDYDPIYDGKWLSDGKYYVIHKFATDTYSRRKGYAKSMLSKIEDLALKNSIFSIKIDTHKDNKIMRSFLQKNGFTECGRVILELSGERIAYEKLLK